MVCDDDIPLPLNERLGFYQGFRGSWGFPLCGRVVPLHWLQGTTPISDDSFHLDYSVLERLSPLPWGRYVWSASRCWLGYPRDAQTPGVRLQNEIMDLGSLHVPQADRLDLLEASTYSYIRHIRIYLEGMSLPGMSQYWSRSEHSLYTMEGHFLILSPLPLCLFLFLQEFKEGCH